MTAYKLVSSTEERWSHDPEVEGSKPSQATFFSAPGMNGSTRLFAFNEKKRMQYLIQ